jgi:hypothetical protein
VNVTDLWRSSDPLAWDHAVQHYWNFVQPRNVELERSLNALELTRVKNFNPKGWYDFLHDEYFRWKYTAPNRYATTTIQLRKYIDSGTLAELEGLRQQILNFDLTDVRLGLKTAMKIRGLGTAGASGLLSLIYPEHFATVDQFVVKALRFVNDLPEANAILKMNPQNLTVTDGVLLVGILSRKAKENNRLFGTHSWTPRKIDMVLWTYGR